MGYCTISDVQAEFKNVTFGPTTNPSATTIQNTFMPQADAEINAKIGLRYAVPVNTTSSPTAALTLKQLSVWLVTARIKDIIKVKTGAPQTSQDGRSGDTRKQAYDMLDQIAKGQFLLLDAPLVNNTQGMQNFGYSSGEPFIFNRDSDNY